MLNLQFDALQCHHRFERPSPLCRRFVILPEHQKINFRSMASAQDLL
jgi:hypothetical protein